MALFDAVKDKLGFVRALTPENLKKLGNARLSTLIDRESVSAKAKLESLQQRFPSAGPRELAQRMIDEKKGLASVVGGISGVFGVVTVPADLLVMVYLQLGLLVEVATLYKVNLKSDRAKQELLDVFYYANGIGKLTRASPKVLGKVAAMLLHKGGLETLGRAMPLVAAPISAYLNNQHVQKIGDEAVRHYDGFSAVSQKAKKASTT